MDSALPIGIDLGTTFSCVGVFKNGAVEIITNGSGKRTTPSVVGFDAQQRYIGEEAQIASVSNPANTVYDAKRMMGRGFDDPAIQEDMQNWPFTVIEHEGKPQVEVTYRGVCYSFFPEEISSMVLIKMKEIAEAKLAKPVKDAVITVPAYFNNAQRQATIDAGTIAGLNVLQLLTEPVAAAIAYGLDKKRQGERKVLIFDLGGGTFDVSILTVNGDKFSVKTHGGNSHLGGEDFNNRMINHIVSEFARKHGHDISNDRTALAKLRKHCEKAKRNLTTAPVARFEIENLYDGILFVSSMTRAKFEDLNKDLFQFTIDEVGRTLAKINMSKSSIDDVVLIGGSTRIPKIQEMLQAFFDGKDLYKSINPDEAVAYGAALYAAVISKNDADLSGFTFADVTPLSLGTDKEGEINDILIPLNSTIPCEKTNTYKTAKENQTSMSVQVLEGERVLCKDNNLLGKFSLNNLPARPRGEAKADVTFKIDANGILHITAKDKANSRNVLYEKLTYDRHRLSPQEINRMIEDAARFRADDENQMQLVLARNEVERGRGDALAEANRGRPVTTNTTNTVNNQAPGGVAGVPSGQESIHMEHTRWQGRARVHVPLDIPILGRVPVDIELEGQYEHRKMDYQRN